MAQNMHKQVLAAKSLRPDQTVFFLSHQETISDADGNVKFKAKTVGKMVDNVVTYEGMFSMVLFTFKEETKTGTEYGFITNGDPKSTAKSPRGMFEDSRIPNDLKIVVDAIKKYEED
jgi:hypothetical protein